jgi:uncharacterized membrane protein
MRSATLAAVAVAATLAGLAACGGGSDEGGNEAAPSDPELAAVQEIVERRCYACHSSEPTEYGYDTAPAGLAFDEPGAVEAAAAKIYERAVVKADMPLLNQTGMTLAERNRIAIWFRRRTGEPLDPGTTNPEA